MQVAREHMAVQSVQNPGSSESLYTFDRTRDDPRSGKLPNAMPVYIRGEVRNLNSRSRNQRLPAPTEKNKSEKPGGSSIHHQQQQLKANRPKKQNPAPRAPIKKDAAPRVNIDKILVYPAASGSSGSNAEEGQKQDSVMQILKKSSVRPSQAGIRNMVEFVSGASLLIVDRNKADTLRELLPNIGLRIKGEPIPRCHNFRIHGISADDTTEEIAGDIAERLGFSPIKVVKVPYRNGDDTSSAMAVVECGLALYEAAARRSTVLIGYSLCRIDTKLHLMRCQTCRVFGHTRNHCPGIPDRVKKTVEEQPGTCLDCLIYNDRLQTAGLPRVQLRDTRHSAGSSTCRSLQTLRKKFAEARKPNNLEEVVSDS